MILISVHLTIINLNLLNLIETYSLIAELTIKLRCLFIGNKFQLIGEFVGLTIFKLFLYFQKLNFIYLKVNSFINNKLKNGNLKV